MVKALTYKKLAKVLERNNFILSRQKGSHMIYKNTITGIAVTVPMHGKNSKIKIGTFMAIIKQSKLEKSIFNI